MMKRILLAGLGGVGALVAVLFGLAFAAPVGPVQYAALNAITGALKYTATTGLFSQAGASDLSNGVSGSGLVILQTSPTIASPTITAAFTATGLVTNADLVSPSVTVNGTTCTLGSTCSPSASGIVVGSTGVGGGTTTRILFDNAGTLGEYVISGSGSVAMNTSPSLTSPSLGTSYLSQSTANASSTGTTVNRLAKFTSTGAVILTTSDTSIGNLIGVCASGCGTTDSGQFATSGTVTADFDNATVAGDYVIASVTTAGKVHDAGATLPTGVNVVGFADSTNVSGAGSYALNINPVGIANATGTALAPAGANGAVQTKSGATLAGITPVSGGVLGATSSSQAAYSAALASNALVLGGGAGAVPATAAGFATDGTSVLTLGVAGTSAGGLKLSGLTSGTTTVKTAAVAGTTTITLPGGTTDFSSTGGANQVVKQSSSGAALTVAPLGSGDVPCAAMPALTGGVTSSAGSCATTAAATTLASGTSVSLTAPRQYYVCTSTCTVTPPVPAAGYEFCILNDDNVSTVITLAALGSSARYENTARTAYGTAGTGTFVSGAAAANKVCIVGLDATHYLTTAYNGTWTAN